MKLYKDLNLREIRDKADLDFAHFTYKKGMCSCCHNPLDLPKRYWKGNTLPKCEAWYHEDGKGYQYLLFKNAENVNGCVTRNDEIDNVCIEWGFPIEKLDIVCKLLQEQLGDEYVVTKPNCYEKCIGIKLK